MQTSDSSKLERIAGQNFRVSGIKQDEFSYAKCALIRLLSHFKAHSPAAALLTCSSNFYRQNHWMWVIMKGIFRLLI
jgi:hypothetical protein